jgi:hypothetical protein
MEWPILLATGMQTVTSSRSLSLSLSSSLCVKLEKCFLFLFGGRVLFFRKKKKKKFLALLQFFLFFGGERERGRGRILVQVEYSVKPVWSISYSQTAH